MNLRNIKIENISSVPELKIEILKRINIYDFKKDCLIEFETRIANYLQRNKNEQLIFHINKESLFQGIYNRHYITKVNPKIPDNYPLGASNMETQCYYDPVPTNIMIIVKNKSEEEFEKTIKDISEISFGENFGIIFN